MALFTNTMTTRGRDTEAPMVGVLFEPVLVIITLSRVLNREEIMGFLSC